MKNNLDNVIIVPHEKNYMETSMKRIIWKQRNINNRILFKHLL